MAKIRVHELAKELGMNSRDLVNQLLDLGIQVKNHFSTLEESEVAKIKSQRKTDKPLPDATKTENRVQKPADSRSAMKGLEKKSIPKNSEESRSKPEVGPTDRFDRKNQRKPAGVPNAGGAHRAAQERFLRASGAMAAWAAAGLGRVLAGCRPSEPGRRISCSARASEVAGASGGPP